jgi:hypothetical protein
VSFGSGFNGVSGSGSRETKIVPEKEGERKLMFFMLEELSVGLEASPGA